MSLSLAATLPASLARITKRFFFFQFSRRKSFLARPYDVFRPCWDWYIKQWVVRPCNQFLFLPLNQPTMSDLLNKPLPTGDFKFQYIAIDEQDPNQESCKMPQTEEWANFIKENKTVVLTGAPAAFSPTCSVNHIPEYISYLNELVKDKGVDQVVVITVDNPFANQAWAKTLGVKSTAHIKFASDAGGHFVKKLGLDLPLGDDVYWSGRWAAVVKNGTVTYVGKETNPATDVTVSSVESVLAHL